MATIAPNKTQSTYNRIKTADADTCFVMVSSIPVREYDPEDKFCFGMEAHKIRKSGDCAAMVAYYESLILRVRNAAVTNEDVELFMREEGRDYLRFVFFNGDRAIQTTLCNKEKALALAF